MNKGFKKVLAAVLALVIGATAVRCDVSAAEGGNIQPTENGSVQPAEMAVSEVSVSDGNITQDTENGEGWDGEATEAVYEAENYKVTFRLTGYWEGGYNATVQIENTGDSIIENWYLGLDYPSVIADIWNAETVTGDNGRYMIKNAGWNQDIAAGGHVEFGFSGKESFAGFPKQYELLGTMNTVGEEDYSIEYSVASEWESGFTSSITITNHTDSVLEDWVLEFDFGREMDSVWDAQLVSHEGNHYVVQNSGYNSRVLQGQKVSFGFTGHGGRPGEEPLHYTLYSYIPVTDEMIETEDTGSADWDDDGLTNAKEAVYGTNPADYDTDGDGFSDYYEIEHHMDPLVYDGIPLSRTTVDLLDDYTEVDLQVLNVDEYYPLEIEYGESGLIESISGKFSNMEIESPTEALYAVYNIKTLLGLDEPGEQLKPIQVAHNYSGDAYSFQQIYKGLEIRGNTITVSVDRNGNTTSLYAVLTPDSRLSRIAEIPVIPEEEAEKAIAEQYGNGEITSCQLIWYRETLDADFFRVYEVNAVVDGQTHGFVVDAATGEVLDKYETGVYATVQGKGINDEKQEVTFPVNKHSYKGYSYVMEDVDRKIYVYDDSNDKRCVASVFNVWTDPIAISDYQNVITSYDWLKNNYGYIGLNGRGGDTSIYIHVEELLNNGQYVINREKIRLGDEEVFLERELCAPKLIKVAHEFSHAVFQHRALLFNGKTNKVVDTINEAYADILGSFINSGDWMEHPRNIAKPNLKSNPAYIGDIFYDENYGDPHINSTILSHAAYLMKDTYHIPMDRLHTIWYESMSESVYYWADFQTVRTNVIKAARKNGFSEEEISYIRMAFDEVGVKDYYGSVSILVSAGSDVVQNAQVTLSQYGTSVTGRTDEEGEVRFTDIPTGTNQIRVEVEGYGQVLSQILVKKNRTVYKYIQLISSTSSFDWREFDHYNYADVYAATIPKHIISDDQNIKMVGYSRAPIKDFLLTENINGEETGYHFDQKYLTFQMERDANNWHTMEGGGFLFNAVLDDADRLSGYCILVTQGGLKLYELEDIDATAFSDGRLGNMYSVGKELGTYDIGNVLEPHSFALRITNASVTMWCDGNIIIDDYKLPDIYGYEFGPITSHISHACSQISYFTFSDIRMTSISE